jgi:molybdenum cofactor cytidylyltransferase
MLHMAPWSEQSPTSGSPMARRVVAVVLASGASSRMGTPKALLDFDGTSCLELVLRACGPRPVVLVTAPEADAIRARAGAVTHSVNPHPERGMLSSLQAGLAALPSWADAFLLFPVDYPLVPAAEVDRLCAARGLIVAPSHQRRRGHPVLLDRRLVPELLAATDSARSVIDAHQHEIVYIETGDERVLMDMDTPDDYRKCLTRHRADT